MLEPNSAGKSTLVKRVMGLLKPTRGTITLGHHDLANNPAAARQLYQYLPQAQMPIDSFKARQAIEIARLNHGGETDEVRRLAMGVWDEQARTSPEKQFWAS